MNYFGDFYRIIYTKKWAHSKDRSLVLFQILYSKFSQESIKNNY